MKTPIKAATALFFLLLLLTAAAALADGSLPGQRICLVCGSPTDASECAACGALRECWVCNGCLTKNLSDTCLSCGKSKRTPSPSRPRIPV